MLFDESFSWYWVLPGQFLCGPYPGALNDQEAVYKLRLLLGAGISQFIDLTEENESGLKPYAGLLNQVSIESNRIVSHSRFPIPDFGIPSVEEMTKILNQIDHQLNRQENVFLHCRGGVGRTGLVVGCYLVRNGLSGEEALSRLKVLRQNTPKSGRPSPETLTQRQYILDWYKHDI